MVSAMSHVEESAGADATVRLWEVATGRLLQTFMGHVGIIYHLAFSPDGKFLASTGNDQTVKVWTLENVK